MSEQDRRMFLKRLGLLASVPFMGTTLPDVSEASLEGDPLEYLQAGIDLQNESIKHLESMFWRFDPKKEPEHEFGVRCVCGSVVEWKLPLNLSYEELKALSENGFECKAYPNTPGHSQAFQLLEDQHGMIRHSMNADCYDVMMQAYIDARKLYEDCLAETLAAKG